MTRSIGGARRAAAVLAGTAAGAALLLSGCGAGQIAETAERIPTNLGVNAESPDNNYLVRNAFVGYPGTAGYPAGANAPMSVTLYNETGEPVTVRVGSTAAGGVTLTGPSAAPSPGGGAPASPSPEATAGSPAPDATAGSPAPDATAGSPSPEATQESPSPGGSPSADSTAAPAPATPAEIQIPAHGFVVLNQETAGRWLQLTGLAEALPPGHSIQVTFDFGGTQVPVQVPVTVPLEPAPPGTPVVGGEEEEHE
ncbi:hypothetical protein ACN27G_33355 [Plantactinospora sp. WMMB334]|uniref:hypothetical protein n=1 Tax=Plantactinospora sp. WMMB334 TaxID=3404119 RepID=UPI003B946D69